MNFISIKDELVNLSLIQKITKLDGTSFELNLWFNTIDKVTISFDIKQERDKSYDSLVSYLKTKSC